MKAILFFFLFTLGITAQNRPLKEGDLIFQNLNCGPMCEAINTVTQGYNEMDFNHMGMVFKQDNEWYVIEAAGEAVRKTPVSVFLTYTDNPMYLARLKSEYQHLIPKAIDFAKSQIGVPYDNDFIYNNGKYYCSELIYDAFLQAYQKPFFQLYPMTYKEPQSNNYFPVWVQHFSSLGIEIPEGKPGCNPGGMSKDEKIDILGIIR
ncbi:YiiX/YebB-like N1pC/P60 family cysteine hydrolase [Myroides ceti]|uniref:YiiX/YebB-like N1pC/P60 family cysteine hydrolase n=1 Tax=Paenimyroides ceti TaxID=395087 RepID=A0ABT8CUD3_9FLAO|nr:YiiX/YebB-like N1pC/P60 family cysteine hydrolase [Paenimyroides ceti]MDN3708118.1 YiiX/YebB-like N1pC/P60 family cysteine hydrolase [Paenimyroides ceti]